MIVLSGGAKGADTLFGLLDNTTCYHMSFEGHKSSIPLNGKVVKIPDSVLYSRKPRLQQICKENYLNYPTDDFVEKLLLRNLWQVENKQFKSELVIAICPLQPTRKGVKGGTNWAILEAKSKRILIVVLNTDDNYWYYWDYVLDKFEYLQHDISVKGIKVITGIGSRNLKENKVPYYYNKIKEALFKYKCISNRR